MHLNLLMPSPTRDLDRRSGGGASRRTCRPAGPSTVSFSSIQHLTVEPAISLSNAWAKSHRDEIGQLQAVAWQVAPIIGSHHLNVLRNVRLVKNYLKELVTRFPALIHCIALTTRTVVVLALFVANDRIIVGRRFSDGVCLVNGVRRRTRAWLRSGSGRTGRVGPVAFDPVFAATALARARCRAWSVYSDTRATTALAVGLAAASPMGASLLHGSTCGTFCVAASVAVGQLNDYCVVCVEHLFEACKLFGPLCAGGLSICARRMLLREDRREVFACTINIKAHDNSTTVQARVAPAGSFPRRCSRTSITPSTCMTRITCEHMRLFWNP